MNDQLTEIEALNAQYDVVTQEWWLQSDCDNSEWNRSINRRRAALHDRIVELSVSSAVPVFEVESFTHSTGRHVGVKCFRSPEAAAHLIAHLPKYLKARSYHYTLVDGSKSTYCVVSFPTFKLVANGATGEANEAAFKRLTYILGKVQWYVVHTCQNSETKAQLRAALGLQQV